MKRTIFILIWIIFWLGLGSTWLNNFPTEFVRLDLIFIAVVAIGFAHDFEERVPYIIMIGFISDALSPAPFGIMTIVYLSIFALIRFAATTIFIDSITARFLWTTAASLIATLLRGILFGLYYKNPRFIELSFMRFIPQAVLTGVIGVFMIPLFYWYINLSWEKLFKPKGLVLK